MLDDQNNKIPTNEKDGDNWLTPILVELDGENQDDKSYINGWVVIFALLNLLMGITSLATLQKASATNLEMAKIRVVLQDSYSQVRQENIILAEQNFIIKKQIKTVNARLENIENKIKLIEKD